MINKIATMPMECPCAQPGVASGSIQGSTRLPDIVFRCIPAESRILQPLSPNSTATWAGERSGLLH